MTIETSETDLSIADVPESEVFDISDFKDFRVSLKNRNVGNIVEFPKRKNVNSQHVRVDQRINIEGGYICEKDSGSSYHMRINLTGNMHVGRIIIKVGENIKKLTGEHPEGG